MTPDEKAAFRAAMRNVSSNLLAYFERRVRSKEDAADLLGETMLQAWRRVDAFPAGDTARQRMWMFTIAANVLANHARSNRRRSALTDRLRASLAVAPTAPGVADLNAVRDAVLRLHDAHRELVMLIHWDGFTILEAAEVLDLNPSTARGRYAAARSVLRETLAESAVSSTSAHNA